MPSTALFFICYVSRNAVACLIIVKSLSQNFGNSKFIFIFAPAFNRNECLTYLLSKNESIRNRFHFNSRFV